MHTIKGSPWIAYFIVYIGGFAGLMYLMRVPSIDSPWLYLPFAFPVTLVALAVLLASAEADSEADNRQLPITPLIRADSVGRPTWSWTTYVALTLIAPFNLWLYPAGMGAPRLRLFFEIWWLAVTAFTALILPRLLRTTRVQAPAGSRQLRQ
jgi:1,4-dihydroxy-2-naphthoate octaprenyltransferase